MDLRIILFDALSNRPQFKLNSLFVDEPQKETESFNMIDYQILRTASDFNLYHLAHPGVYVIWYNVKLNVLEMFLQESYTSEIYEF